MSIHVCCYSYWVLDHCSGDESLGSEIYETPWLHIPMLLCQLVSTSQVYILDSSWSVISNAGYLSLKWVRSGKESENTVWSAEIPKVILFQNSKEHNKFVEINDKPKRVLEAKKWWRQRGV